MRETDSLLRLERRRIRKDKLMMLSRMKSMMKSESRMKSRTKSTMRLY
jgi:hypothetical protein